MSLNYQGTSENITENISAFDFDAWMAEKSGSALDNFYNLEEAYTKDYLIELTRRLFESQPNKNYQAVKFSNPIMQKLKDFDWGEWQKRVQIMISPKHEFVVFILYKEELKETDNMIPAKRTK